ncbi:hypothetical protein [uncultured Pseudomonas sp.]|uniref:hypothetical protein n=1 Tax=uncultured Pseudomonas sp. TaxID=114707 RepID=UPI00258EAA22|nr:hypothetical protein [uncultured Pseudomonas sp.]
MAKPFNEKQQTKLTVILDPELAAMLENERARIEKREGFKVSLTQIASRAMRQSFQAATA